MPVGLFYWISIMQTIPLKDDQRDLLATAEAAIHLNRKPQTLRSWACFQNGPIQPVRVFGRLGWRVADIRKLLEMAQ